jgi:hypothetical protein
MSNDALILDLAADLRPVRRRSPSREALLLLGVAGAEVAVILIAGVMRPDMGRMIGSAFMIWKIASLALLTLLATAVAVRSFSPAGPAGRGLLPAAGLAGLAVLIGLIGLIVTPAAEAARPLAERIAPVHGMVCAVAIMVLALPLLAVLGLVMRRAAPTRPRISALAAGIAAGTGGALVFTLCCPMNDPLYVILWYGLACAAITFISRWLLPRRFRL